MQDEFYMNLALNEAWRYQLLTYPNPAVGAVIVDKSGQILATGAHKKAGGYHAEVEAVRAVLGDFSYEQIFERFAGHFKGAKIYVTLEPCSHSGKTPPCAQLLVRLGFSEVIIGTRDETLKRGGVQILKEGGARVKMGVLQKECEDLIEPFLLWSKGGFSLLKLAMSLNGVLSGGTISCEESRAHMHHIRALITRLVIGANSVRTDMPTLDSRLARIDKAPDMLILTKDKERFASWLHSAKPPLLGVANRKVQISSDCERALGEKFVMIESGGGLVGLNFDWLLIYQAPKFLNGTNFSAFVDFELLKSVKIGVDNVLFLRRKR